MKDLIEKLEQASEGSRTLDGELWLAINEPPASLRGAYGVMLHAPDCRRNPNASPAGCTCGAATYNDNAPWVRGFIAAKGAEDYPCQHLVPRWTTSLDAALPYEDVVQVKRLTYGHPDGDKWEAVHKYDSLGVTAGVGRTETLARRIAALKARATQGKD